MEVAQQMNAVYVGALIGQVTTILRTTHYQINKHIHRFVFQHTKKKALSLPIQLVPVFIKFIELFNLTHPW